MNFGVITTSRADFGIYIPLLQQIKSRGHRFKLFVGGMHVSAQFGMSFNLIEKGGFEIAEKIEGLVDDDSPQGISLSMSNTLAGYGKIWPRYKKELDLVFVLGDRFEMYAAASSLVPFNIPIAHLHGGETTLGAIDNKFRHAITMLSDFHFTSHIENAKKVQQMIGSDHNVFNVGALGVEAIINQELFTAEEFKKKFSFDISKPFILTTIHTETVAIGKNEEYINQFIEAIKKINIPILCTLPNADTDGKIIRAALLEFEVNNPHLIKCFENLGVKGYFTAMKNCLLMIGNTSSGIIEAASFKKPVVNLGDRQKGRNSGKNVSHVLFEKDAIVNSVNFLMNKNTEDIVNPYYQENTARKIIEILEDKLK